MNAPFDVLCGLESAAESVLSDDESEADSRGAIKRLHLPPPPFFVFNGKSNFSNVKRQFCRDINVSSQIFQYFSCESYFRFKKREVPKG